MIEMSNKPSGVAITQVSDQGSNNDIRNYKRWLEQTSLKITDS